MQSRSELVELISQRHDNETAERWADFLLQLQGCHLYALSDPNKDKEEWLRDRQAGIGGSEIAAVLGENHWNSPRQIWMSKMGMFDDKPPQQSEAARWGNLLETTVATEWGLREDKKWIHIPVILQDDDRPWLLANIDGFVLDDTGTVITGILEIKTTSAYNKSAWETGPLPYHYICQTNWYCGITRLKEFTLVCLVGGQTLYHYTLPADATLFDREVKAADEFWLEYVKKGVEPPATAVDKALMQRADAEAAAAGVTPEEKTTVKDDDESERLIEGYVQVRDKIKAMTDVKDALYAEIRKLLADNTQVLTNTHTVTLKRSARRTCNFELLEAQFPEAYAAAVSQSITSSMNIV